MSDLAVLESRFRRLAELRVDRDIDAVAAKRSEEAYREYEAELLSIVEDSGLKGSIEFDFGGDLGIISFQRRKTTYGRIIDKAAAMAAFEEEGMFEAMTGQKIEARRLNELVRERQEAGEDLPNGVDYYDKRFISISHKSKK